MRPEDHVRVLRLRLGHTIVGVLRVAGNRVTFVPNERWAADRRRPVLGQRFEDDPTARIGTSGRIPAWFSNLLPEGPFRVLVARANELRETQELALLEALGGDLPGALVVERSLGADLGELVVDTVQATPSAATADAPLKFSLAGVQVKFSARMTDDGRGLVIPMMGQGGDWIVKLPDGRYPGVPENEWSMLQWAQACDVSVPEKRLLRLDQIENLPTELVGQANEDVVLAVRRFDRVDGGRLHLEDFAQVLGVWPEQKYAVGSYETLARLVEVITRGEDLPELLRRYVLMIAMGNGDAHLKNWSLLYVDPRTARLSPAYDLVCTTAYISTDRLALNLGGSKQIRGVDEGRMRRLLEQAGLDADLIDVARDTARLAKRAWVDLREELPCSEAVKVAVDAQLEDNPLFAP